MIHAVHCNDMFEMGGLRKYMPMTYATFIIGSLALAGVPAARRVLVEGRDRRRGLRRRDTRSCSSRRSSRRSSPPSTWRRACTLTFFGRYRRMPIAGGAGDDDDAPSTTAHAARVAADHDVAADHPRGALGRRRLGRHAGQEPVRRLVPLRGRAPRRVRPVDRRPVDRRSRSSGIGDRPAHVLAGATFGFGVLDPLAKLGPLYRAAERKFYIDDFYLKVFVKPVQYPTRALRLQRPRSEGHRRRP